MNESLDIQKLKCPECGHETAVSLKAKIAPESRTAITFTPKSGQMMTAKAIGESISAYADLLSAVAEGIGGTTVTFMEAAGVESDGSLRFDFVTLETKSAPQPKESEKS